MEKFNSPADQLGTVQAAIAELRKEEARLKGLIVDMEGDEGDLFKATFIESERNQVDWKTIAQRLEPSHQLVRAHTTRKVVRQVRVTAKPTTTKAAA